MFFNIFNRLLVAKTCLRHESAVLSSLFRRKHFILWYSKKKNSACCVYKDLASQVTRIQELDMRNYVFIFLIWNCFGLFLMKIRRISFVWEEIAATDGQLLLKLTWTSFSNSLYGVSSPIELMEARLFLCLKMFFHGFEPD